MCYPAEAKDTTPKKGIVLKMKYIALVGTDCPKEAIAALRRRDNITDVITLPPDDLINSPIAAHPDTILFIHKSKLYCHQSYAKKNSALLADICNRCGLDIITDNEERNSKYPFDCSYNALYVPGTDTVIGNKKALSAPLRAICSADTKQGYAACCALAVDKTVITADPSIKKAALSAGIEVFTVSGGDISLRGYDTGFIGGCTGVIHKTVFTVGDTDSCETGRQLAEFCRTHCFEIISLCHTSLTDVGGIKLIPIAR